MKTLYPYALPAMLALFLATGRARGEQLIDLAGSFDPFAQQASAEAESFDLVDVCARCRAKLT